MRTFEKTLDRIKQRLPLKSHYRNFKHEFILVLLHFILLLLLLVTPLLQSELLVTPLLQFDSILQASFKQA